MKRLAIVFESEDTFDLTRWVDGIFQGLQFTELEYAPLSKASIMGVTEDNKLVE